MAVQKTHHKHPRDFQRSRCYKWQEEFVDCRGWPELGLAECEEIVVAIFRRARRRIPEVDGCKGFFAEFHATNKGEDDDRVRVPVPHCVVNLPLVLHECAHGLVYYRYPDTVSDHGPEFVATFIRLLAKYGGMSAIALRRSARAAGLKVGR